MVTKLHDPVECLSSLGVVTNPGPIQTPYNFQSSTQGLQVCKWYLLWGLKSINRTYFGLFGALGVSYIELKTELRRALRVLRGSKG